MFDANNPEQSEIKLRGKPEDTSIYDLAFSKDGDYLYVSGTAVRCIALVYSVELEGSCLNRIKHVATPKYNLVSYSRSPKKKKKKKEKVGRHDERKKP